MKRNEVNINETWDLSLIYNTINEFNDDFNKASQLLNKLSSLKESFTSTLKTFLTFNEDYTLLSRLVAKLYQYAHLNVDVEPDNQDYQLLLSKVLSFYDQMTSSLDFINVEILAHEDKVIEYLKDEKFKPYRFSINEILREKPHILSKELETLLSKVSPIANISEQTFDALRLEYEDIIIDGEKKPLNSATLNEYLRHNNQEVRKQAFHNFYKEYKKFENVFANTLSGVMKKDAFYADVRKFKDPLNASLFEDNVPEELFYKILNKANNEYRYLFHRYNKLKKKILNLDEIYNYDLFTPLVNNVDSSFTIEESKNIILDVTKVFGDEYTTIINKAFDERWIDFHPTNKKRSGAYSAGSYDTKPYILTNFIGNYDSLSTLIHELGHSAHTYLSSHYQDAINSDYRIFVAEVASTVNETLLINYMLDKCNDNNEKAYYLYEFLENCVGLIFRQPLYAQFEDTLHIWAKENKPMNASSITDLYAKLNKEYYGEDVLLDDLVGHSCFYIPHFYYNYYVYKYTLGMTVSLAICARILKGDKTQIENYLSFLKSGGSMSPVDLLIKAGVNPLEDEIYDDAFKYFEDLLNKFEEIYYEKN